MQAINITDCQEKKRKFYCLENKEFAYTLTASSNGRKEPVSEKSKGDGIHNTTEMTTPFKKKKLCEGGIFVNNASLFYNVPTRNALRCQRYQNKTKILATKASKKLV